MHQESSRKRYRIAALQAKSENQGGTVHNAPLGSNTQGCFFILKIIRHNFALYSF